MCQIKEKAPATPTSVTSATTKLHIKNTTNPTKKQPFSISEYLEYCDRVGKQPNSLTIEFMGLPFEPPQYIGKTEEEQEIELIKNVEKLAPADRAAMLEVIAFMIWKNKRNLT